MKSSRENLLAFTHTLEKREDGSCGFLNNDKHCQLHADYGVESKPAMCRLFPFSFTVTPDAVLCSLSFASSAVLRNEGELLAAQPEILESQYEMFRRLFKPKTDLWQATQLIDGIPLNWQEFRRLDQRLASIMEERGNGEDRQPGNLPCKLGQSASFLAGQLAGPSACEREPRLESRPKIVDQILLKHLEKLYFPARVFAEQEYDLNARAMLAEMVSAPQAVSFGQGAGECRFRDLIGLKLGGLPAELEDLLNRFLYVRFFSKQYFGPGFHHLSLLAGINHLRILHILLRLKIKQVLLTNKSVDASFDEVCELVRTLERRLSQLDLSSQSLAMLEVMLSSMQRQERISFLAE